MAKKLSGTITHDPIHQAPIGTQLEFSSRLFPPIGVSISGTLDDWTHFGGAVLSVGFGNGISYSIEGSAVMIAPGVALAAKHIFEPHIDKIMAGVISPMLQAIRPNGVTLWKLTHITSSKDNHDIVILSLNLSSDFPEEGLWQSTITTRVPNIGEQLMIAGFRSSDVGDLEHGIKKDTRIGIGEITAVYPSGRDKVMMPHPCFEVECVTLGGMSGGPIFDQNGKLIGILGSSFGEIGAPSYGYFIAPILNLPLKNFWLPNITTLPTSILNLAKRGLVSID